MDNDRKPFTNHSLHLNVQVNKTLSNLIVSHTYSIMEQKMDPLIILNWKSNQNQTVPLNKNKKVVNRTCTRPKKSPLLRSDDFLL